MVWMFCPVQIRLNVMANMVSIIPAVVIVLVVNTGYTALYSFLDLLDQQRRAVPSFQASW